ncbi:MAG: SDR family oxidoreductase [Spirochaeta sp.]
MLNSDPDTADEKTTPAVKPRVLVAGATGYLGRAVLSELKKQGCWIRAIVRSPQQAAELQTQVDEVITARVTSARELTGIADSIDVVFSSVGITRQKDGLSYQDVDYGANHNLLHEAIRAGVPLFIYTSVYNAQALGESAMVHAKERFVRELQAAPIQSCIIRPTGFFSDMEGFMLRSALKNRAIPLFARGQQRLNPISGRDLAQVIVQCIPQAPAEVPVGGPYVYTMRELAELAFQAAGRSPKLLLLPAWCARLLRRLIVFFTPPSVHGPVEFSLLAALHDWEAPAAGSDSIADFFRQRAAQWRQDHAQDS